MSTSYNNEKQSGSGLLERQGLNVCFVGKVSVECLLTCSYVKILTARELYNYSQRNTHLA